MQLKSSFFLFLYAGILLLQSCNRPITVHRSDEGIEVRENGKKVLFYQTLPKSVNGRYERAGYIHPLYDLNGNVLTEDGPDDHPFHRGIFWAWHQIVAGNKNIADGWISENIAFVPSEVTTRQSGKEAVIQAALVWKHLSGSDTLADLIRETTTITIYPSEAHYRALDFDIRLRPLIDSIGLGGSDDVKGYGGFCLRLKLPSDLAFHSQGTAVIAKETAVTAGPWMDFIGSFNSGTSSSAGITVFCYTPYPGPQQWWILRKKTSMQNVAFPGRVPKLLPPEGWTLKYRLIVHDETIGQQELEKLYRLYADGQIRD